MKTIICIILSWGFSSCETEPGDCHRKIYIYNKSESEIYFLAKTDSILRPSSQSPVLYPNYKIKQNSQAYAKHTTQADCWENVINEFNYIYIFVFDAEIIETEDWDSIVKNGLFINRYDLTLDDLKEIDWKIYYE